MITVDHLSKSYQRNAAVRAVSFTCGSGTVTGLLGPNGSGKSTVLRLVCGRVAPSAGRAFVNGVDYSGVPNLGRRVGALLGDEPPFHTFTARAALTISAKFIGVREERVGEMLRLAGLPARIEESPLGEYSPGHRRRFDLVRALLGDPNVLVLDEPVAGLDADGAAWMWERIRDFAAGGGTVLLSSRSPQEVEPVVDQVVLLSEGAVAWRGGRDEMFRGAGAFGRIPAARRPVGRAAGAAG
ncbi:ABC transporter ATP-binding protein [Amycolatopsis sp. CA-230715]|uniref:ABC transporter ATP-binding protein n=1 Tax=Amycolatopsis sp. CA-230715 TaxID=2745196 RepID=UPI001C02E00A|nr:ABC transporter ATP-binding protein [Amycolatopsis sp. CA-230715]QWF78564.1 putative ABC transporter ATP-binding protein YxlF [Amycolatopsis sp. CA-230715]